MIKNILISLLIVYSAVVTKMFCAADQGCAYLFSRYMEYVAKYEEAKTEIIKLTFDTDSHAL